MHERLRLELLRRIQRGTVSVSLLGRQNGFGQAHLSNFLHSRRQMSLEALDRILKAQHLAAADLLPSAPQSEPELMGNGVCAVPVVSHATALFEPVIRPSAVQSLLYLPAVTFESIHSRASGSRRAWERFVAVRVSAGDAPPWTRWCSQRRLRCSTGTTIRCCLTGPTARICTRFETAHI
ncbi:MAG: hypothetical protein WDM87_15385 [Terracidiphilus sp.]